MVNNKVYSAFQYIVILLIMLQCNSVFIGMHNIVSYMISILTFVCIFILSLVHLLHFNIKKLILGKLMIFFTIFIILITAFVVVENIYVYSFKVFPVLLWLISIPIMTIFFFISNLYKKILQAFFSKIFSVVYLLGLISLIFLFAYNMGLPTNTSVFNGWNGLVNGYFYLFFVYQHGSVFGLRNSGIFTEPVIFGFVLISALLIYFFILNKKISDNPFKVIIIYITIITTDSSTAYIISVLILMFYFLGKKIGIVSFLFLPIVLIGYYLIDMLYSAKQSVNITSSYAVRMNDIYACFHAWLDGNIFLGNGFGNFTYIFKYVYAYRANSGIIGLSSGFFWMLVSGGIFLMLFTILPSLLVIFKSRRMFLVAFLLNIYTVYGMVSESYLFAMFVALFWSAIISKHINIYDYKE